MSFELKSVNGYGTGALGDVVDPIQQVNTYGYVVSVSGKDVQIANVNKGVYEQFAVGTEVLLHVSAARNLWTTKTSSYLADQCLGNYAVATITAVDPTVVPVTISYAYPGTQTTHNASKLSLSCDVLTALQLNAAELPYVFIQIVTIAQFRSLTINSTVVASPPPWSPRYFCGGIFAFKCTGKLQLDGGIDLTNAGLQPNQYFPSNVLRPLSGQEFHSMRFSKHFNNTDKQYNCDQRGWENHVTKRQLLMNVGDGAMFAVVGSMASSTEGYVGEPDTGVDHTDTYNTPGGSSILMCAGEVADPLLTGTSWICSHYNGVAGVGLGRTYIATNTRLRNDELLYSADVISDPGRLRRVTGIKDFGDGSLGSYTVTGNDKPFNNYASVVNVSPDGFTVTYTDRTTTGMAPFKVGGKVLFHVAKGRRGITNAELGKFVVATITDDNGTDTLKLDTSIFRTVGCSNTALLMYTCQLVTVAQFTQFGFNTNAIYGQTTAWDDTKKLGGVCALMCSQKLEVNKNGNCYSAINLTAKGGGQSYCQAGYDNAVAGNVQSRDRLLLGDGDGSLFVAAKVVALESYITAGWSSFGSLLGTADSYTSNQYAYLNNSGQPITGNNGFTSGDVQNVYGQNGADSNNSWDVKRFGVYKHGGDGLGGSHVIGGSSSRGSSTTANAGLMGPHAFIVADQIDGFNLFSINTGGHWGASTSQCTTMGYGGAGRADNTAYTGGGAAGCCFIYANKVTTGQYDCSKDGVPDDTRANRNTNANRGLISLPVDNVTAAL